MPLYFYLHNAERFRTFLRPPLAEAWRERSFEPCRAFAEDLARAAVAFAARYPIGGEESFAARVAAGGVPFDRGRWRLLIGEALLFLADDVPDLPTAADTLSRVLAEQKSLIHQAHHGSRPLVLGGTYRPDAAGLNDDADVTRLAGELARIDAALWPSPTDAEDEEEAEYARECLNALQTLYWGARDGGHLVICEML